MNGTTATSRSATSSPTLSCSPSVSTLPSLAARVSNVFSTNDCTVNLAWLAKAAKTMQNNEKDTINYSIDLTFINGVKDRVTYPGPRNARACFAEEKRDATFDKLVQAFSAYHACLQDNQ